MPTIYNIGNDVVLSIVVFDENGDDADPDTLTLGIKEPDGILTSFEYGASDIVRDSLGHFHYDLAITKAGLWRYGWHATGTPNLYQESAVDVRRKLVV